MGREEWGAHDRMLGRLTGRVVPLEESDPWLASEFLLIANGIHPMIRAIWVGTKTCAEVGHRGKLLILLKHGQAGGSLRRLHIGYDLVGCEQMQHTITIDESERQVMLLALAELSLTRPGWNFMLAELAGKIPGGVQGFKDFKVTSCCLGCGQPARLTRLGIVGNTLLSRNNIADRDQEPK